MRKFLNNYSLKVGINRMFLQNYVPKVSNKARNRIFIKKSQDFPSPCSDAQRMIKHRLRRKMIYFLFLFVRLLNPFRTSISSTPQLPIFTFRPSQSFILLKFIVLPPSIKSKGLDFVNTHVNISIVYVCQQITRRCHLTKILETSTCCTQVMLLSIN